MFNVVCLCSVSSLNCRVSTVYSALYRVHCIVFIVKVLRQLYSVHCTVNPVNCLIYSEHITVFTVECPLYSDYCTMSTV